MLGLLLWWGTWLYFLCKKIIVIYWFMVYHLPVVRETWVWSLGWEGPLEKEMATHSSILTWRIPWTEEPGGLQTMGLQKSDTTERLHFHFPTENSMEVPQKTKNRITIWSSYPAPENIPGKTIIQKDICNIILLLLSH